jgi:hypothetical protein
MSQGWFKPAPAPEPSPQYEAIDAEVRRLTTALRDAPESAVAAEQDRLRQRAAEITTDLWRSRALRRIDELARLVAKPGIGSSPEYRQANALAGRVLAQTHDDPAGRIAEAEQAIAEIDELARHAPGEESMVIRRLNSPLLRLVEQLRLGGSGR